MNDQIVTSPRNERTTLLDGLSGKILQIILDYAMLRDSLFYIDDPRPGLDRSQCQISSARRYVPRSSTGATDPYFTGCINGTPQHHRTLQPVHRKDWVGITSTCRRFRALGKTSFFRIKTFAMRDSFPARLACDKPNAVKGMTVEDQALALSCIRAIVILNPKETVSIGYLLLPRALALFPSLTRCALLFGFQVEGGYNYDGEYKDESHDVEWITSAFALGGPLSVRMQECMVDIELPKGIELEEAMGPGGYDIAKSGSRWEQQQDLMEEFIYPTLRIKAQITRVKGENIGVVAIQFESKVLP
ncbi:hypothetical protein BKA65DRAFT_498235 [Rhexocercosporidium sp. MPI-PUGE-AT-0058]|nr:hypothetical protein BKA65DRAFT_498235 [Rhexocercosporidium sp. MPI-PUGE-AT-0058]